MWSAIWIAGIILALGRLLAGMATVALWTRRARLMNQVLVSDRVATPLTWGVFRPVILFPACAGEWSGDQMEVALRHEQAHVVRRDWLWQTLANAMNAVFWFHPLVWLANAELRREAESATDDMVLASGVDAADYAEQLVRVARSISSTVPLAAVPMARRGILESRVREILDPLRRRGQASVVSRAAVAVFACVCLVPLLALQESSAGITAIPPAPVPPQASAQIAPAAAEPVRTVRPQGAAPKPGLAEKPAQKPEAVAASSAGVTNPRPLYQAEPAYTEDARIAKVQGSVKLSLVVDEQGRAQDIQVLTSLDPGLDQQAVEAVRQWVFAPGTKDGVPVPVKALIEVNFRLL